MSFHRLVFQEQRNVAIRYWPCRWGTGALESYRCNAGVPDEEQVPNDSGGRRTGQKDEKLLQPSVETRNTTYEHPVRGNGDRKQLENEYDDGKEHGEVLLQLVEELGGFWAQIIGELRKPRLAEMLGRDDV